ncbi:4-alpha-glucanotransferase [bacterium]|nr:4-alpha-glucanotransferase [bacterium]
MPDRTSTFPRRSGVLLHPTCLPGPDGIGDLGPAAYRFVDWLADNGQTWWQMLPLGPTSFGDSPYQTLSAYAGNSLLIDLGDLEDLGWLGPVQEGARPGFAADRVDFGAVIAWKTSRLREAWAGFLGRAAGSVWEEFRAWSAEHAAWVDDFALFMAIKDDQGGKPWTDWPTALVKRSAGEMADAAARLEKEIAFHRFVQWVFHRQWSRLRAHARHRGVGFIGDVPIFVAHDSSDVWARQDLFQLDDTGQPTSIAGVPPDYFSKTGQLWGNPLYDWRAAAAEDYAWWVGRLKACLGLVDVVRLDHFRGFEACWEVPAGAETAENGRWAPGPGAAFFTRLQREFGDELPLIAEDLGVITPAVDELRRGFGLPGMKVLQFAWSGPDNAFLPHEHETDAVVYVGTHDNDPALGWWKHLTDADTRELVAEYAGCEVAEPNWTLIRLGMMSPAHTFIATMQDVLDLGREGRMNLPGEGRGNWNWRMGGDVFDHPGGERLARLTWLYRRRPDQAPAGRVDPEPPPAESLR